MKFTQVGKKRHVAINITSLIDVMFLLLIFVLLSAKFETESGIAVDLPQGKSKETKEPEVEVLSINKDGEIYFGKKKIGLGDLSHEIIAMRKNKKDPILVINADKSANYGIFAEVMDVVKLSEQTKFYFKTKE